MEIWMLFQRPTFAASVDSIDRDRVGVFVVLVAIQIHVVGNSSVNKLVLTLQKH